MKNTLFIFDIDNTLVCSWGIYDEAYRLTSKELLPEEFIMTKNPDGTLDVMFTKMSNPEILENRLKQLGFKNDVVDQKKFFERFDIHAKATAETTDFIVYPGIIDFVKELSKMCDCVILTSGSRQLQLTVLKRAGLIDFFDIDKSFFLGDYSSKKEAIELAYSRSAGLKTVSHVGDAPSDMKAVKSADIRANRLAIGINVQRMVTEQELKLAGADMVIPEYNQKMLIEVISLINR